jgi:hypothetical protein
MVVGCWDLPLDPGTRVMLSAFSFLLFPIECVVASCQTCILAVVRAFHWFEEDAIRLYWIIADVLHPFKRTSLLSIACRFK